MTQVREITEREYTAEELPKQSRLWWGLTAAKLLLRNPGALKKSMVMGPMRSGTSFPRPSELPEYSKGMKYST
jgi:hypothetical protein